MKPSKFRISFKQETNFQVEYWTTELFEVRVIVYSASRCLTSASKLKIQFHLGAHSSNIVDYPLCEYSKGSKTCFTVTPTTYQLLCGSVQMPDNRLKFQIQFSLDSILDEMVTLTAFAELFCR